MFGRGCTPMSPKSSRTGSLVSRRLGLGIVAMYLLHYSYW